MPTEWIRNFTDFEAEQSRVVSRASRFEDCWIAVFLSQVLLIRRYTQMYLTGLRINQCSAGTKRKLSFAIAMIGKHSYRRVASRTERRNGSEIETIFVGYHTMQFSSTRACVSQLIFMCRAMVIRCIFQDGKSAIITSQLMEEMDASCSRIGIVVLNGNLE